MDKLFCYADESGQDTGGTYFAVAVVILDQQSVQGLGRTLETIERETGKRKRKWTNTRSKEKTNYLERVLQIPQLTRGVFFRSFSGTRDYTDAPHHCSSNFRASQRRLSNLY